MLCWYWVGKRERPFVDSLGIDARAPPALPLSDVQVMADLAERDLLVLDGVVFGALCGAPSGVGDGRVELLDVDHVNRWDGGGGTGTWSRCRGLGS